MTGGPIAQDLLVRFERGLRGCEQIEALDARSRALMLPRFERRLCRRNLFWGEVRKGGAARSELSAGFARATCFGGLLERGEPPFE
jgi:hypothetical protein